MGADAKVDVVARLFATDAHNPSFASVRDSLPTKLVPVDFCVPVNRHFPPPELLDELREALPGLVKYYPDYAENHQRALSRFTDVTAEHIVAANGSTELITLLCRHARGPFATDVPTFGRWTDLPLQHGLPTSFIRRRRADDFALGTDRIVRHVRRHGIRTLVLCNPNNPTGAALAADEIERLVHELSDLDLIVIDESFIDFAGIDSAAPLATHTPNLVVVRSLGKSLGWHGVRLGYAVCDAHRAERLRSHVPYWNVNGLAAFVLRRVATLRPQFDASLVRVRSDRDYMLASLRSIDGLRTFASMANFVFAELPHGASGKALRDVLLAEHGLLVRECGNKLGTSERYLRLAVNRPHETDLLSRALQTWLHGCPQPSHRSRRIFDAPS